MGIISWLVVGAIAGYLAGFLVKGDEGLGVIGHIALGIVGGLLGGFLAGLLTGGNDYMTGINITSIVVAVIGAVIAGLRIQLRSEPQWLRWGHRLTEPRTQAKQETGPRAGLFVSARSIDTLNRQTSTVAPATGID